MINEHPTVNLKEVIRKQSPPPSCDQMIQIEVKKASEGVVRCIWTPDSAFINGNGVIMGGLVSSAADVAMAYAVTSVLKEGQTFGTINLNTTFHRPVLPGVVQVDAQVKRQGRSILFVEAELIQNEKLVASATSSVSVISKD